MTGHEKTGLTLSLQNTPVYILVPTVHLLLCMGHTESVSFIQFPMDIYIHDDI